MFASTEARSGSAATQAIRNGVAPDRHADSDLEAGDFFYKFSDLVGESDRLNNLARRDKRRSNECDHDFLPLLLVMGSSSPKKVFQRR
jgi:hypothetical protein